MNLQKVTGQPFAVTCIKCGKKSLTGDETKDHIGRIITEVFYADLDGKPFTDYYCQSCKPIEWDNHWMKLQGFNMNSKGEYQYILWQNIDQNGKYFYQITTGQQPQKDDGGYYNKFALLRLKGLIYLV